MKPGTIVVVLALLLHAALAVADDTNTAKAHYQRATSLFAIGHYDEAAREYEAAYMLRADPALLFDAAQAHRLAGHHQQALVMYKSYVHLYPNSQQANAARTQIAKLSAAIAADEQAKTSPPTETQEPAQVKEPPKPEPKPIVVDKRPPPPATEHQPLYKKWWLWTAVGGAVVAATVITVAVVETRPSNSFSNVPDIGPRAMMLGISWGSR